MFLKFSAYVPKGSQGLELHKSRFVAAACLSAARTHSCSPPKLVIASSSVAVVALSTVFCSARACSMECCDSSARVRGPVVC